MAGTNQSLQQSSITQQPIIILVKPQLGENIGAVARAMLNCRLHQLRLVQPKETWPNEKSRKVCSGADIVIDNTKIFPNLKEAISDLQLVMATTARIRDMVKPVYTPENANQNIISSLSQNIQCGIVFGPERTGLHNDDIALCDAAIQIPLNPGFSSLNLAQSVLLIAYQWHIQTLQKNTSAKNFTRKTDIPAAKADLTYFFDRLEGHLTEGGFLRVEEKKARMMRNIQNIFLKSQLTKQELDTLQGIISCLVNIPSPKTK